MDERGWAGASVAGLKERLHHYPAHLNWVEAQNHRQPEDRRLLAELAERLRVRLVATNTVHYARPSDRPLQDVLTCIKHRTSLDPASGGLLRPNAEFGLKSAASTWPGWYPRGTFTDRRPTTDDRRDIMGRSARKSMIAAPSRQQRAVGDQPGMPSDVGRRSVVGPVRSAQGRLSSVVLVALLTLTLLAAAVRLPGLAGPDGRMDTDETRLALAADGVLSSGLPIMPSGRIYTRGLLNSYLIAPAIALLGRHDFSARLPSLLAGALLVPAMFLLGRALGGTAAGLAAAGFTTLSEPLVGWSRNAWLPSIFLLLFILSAYCCYLGFVERRGGWQVAGAACFCLALFSYEFAVLLPGGLALCLGLCLAKGDCGWYRGRSTLLALGLLVGGLALFGSLLLGLRAGTLAGPLGEFRRYLSPGLSPEPLAFYWRYLFSDYWALVGAAILSLPLLAEARPRGTALLGGLLALAILIPGFGVQDKYQSRYALPALPLLVVLAAAGAAQLARLAGQRLDRPQALRAMLPSLALLAIFGTALHGDSVAAIRRFQRPTPGPTWLQTLQQQGLQQADLLITDAPTVVYYYLGRDDYYLYPEGYERFTYRADDALRSIYTNSALLHWPGDFERLVARPNPGRTVWVIGRHYEFPRWASATDPDLWPSLLSSADRALQSRDGWLLIKLTLQRRNGEG